MGSGTEDEQAETLDEPWVLVNGWIVLLVGVLATVAIVVIGTTWAPRWAVFQADTQNEALIVARQEAVADGAIKLATGIGAATAGILAWGRLQLSRRDHQLAQAQHIATVAAARAQERLTEQGQFTDRYTRAIQQLADTDDVALGGIYALERLGLDSEADRSTITEVLAAYVRQHTSRRRGTAEYEGEKVDTLAPISEPVYAALHVLARRHWHRPDLRGVDLKSARLTEMDLSGFDLRDSIFDGASMSGANLDDADLSGASMTNTYLRSASLEGARLEGATLRGANLRTANLKRAVLEGAGLQEAHLERANLSGAILDMADLTDAALVRSDLTGVSAVATVFVNVEITGANFTGVDVEAMESLGIDWSRVRGVGFGRPPEH